MCVFYAFFSNLHYWIRCIIDTNQQRIGRQTR